MVVKASVMSKTVRSFMADQAIDQEERGGVRAKMVSEISRCSLFCFAGGENEPLQPDADHRVRMQPERAAIRFQGPAILRQLRFRFL